MNPGGYDVSMEIAGRTAMFTRPDTGSAAVSYPAPTYSAAKAMFEAIARFETAFIKPSKVEICRPLQFQSYTTNYRGPLRKANQIDADASYQLRAQVLIDVCYRLHGVVCQAAPARQAANHLHALQAIFERRLAAGQSHYRPCLGWSEFTPLYVGPFRPETRVESSLNVAIPSMLHAVFDRDVSGAFAPRFRQDVCVENGVLHYAE